MIACMLSDRFCTSTTLHIQNPHYSLHYSLYLYPNLKVSNKNKYDIGDRVRITRKRNVFRKGYLPKFTEEVFIIKEILPTSPVTYRLKDEKDEDIIGSFYEAEMVKVV
jgi:hypothetical protein